MKRFAAAAAFALLCTGTAQAQEDAFYKGKAIRILVGLYLGRLLRLLRAPRCRHAESACARPRRGIVENKPGAGGLIATNFLFAQVPKDGTVLGVMPDTIANLQLLEPGNSRWDAAKFNYIGSFTPVNSVIMRRAAAPAKTIEEMRTKEINVGCSGKSAQSYQFTAMLKNLGNFRFKMICGYGGFNDTALALERGEVDLASNGWAGWRVTHMGGLKSGDIVPVYQVGLKRSGELPDVPLAQELVSDPDAKKAIEFLSGGTAVGRALLGPPGMPPARVEFLRGVFDKMVADPAMKELATKRNLELEPTSGAEVQKIVDGIVATPPDIIKKAAAAFE